MKEPAPAIPKSQEVIVWWGGYSPWTMTPSVLLCVVLTGFITWWALTYVDRGNVRFAILSMSGLVWVIQTLRFGYRFFGLNYQATTKRLVHDWGIVHKGMRTIFLKDVAKVEVQRTALEEFLGVGRIVIRAKGDARPMIWRGVRHCNQAAEIVRGLVARSQE